MDFLPLLVDFFLVLVDLRPVLFLLDDDFLRPSVDLRPVLLRPVLFLPVEDFLRPPVDFLRVPEEVPLELFRPVAFLRPPDDFVPPVDLRVRGALSPEPL